MEYLTPGIRLGTLWTFMGSDVDLGFVLIGAGASLVITIVRPYEWVTISVWTVLGIILYLRFRAGSRGTAPDRPEG